MDQKELAIRTGLDKKTINQIIKGIHALSQQTAIKFERATGVPARMWNNLEMQFQERLARQRDRERLESELEWLKEIPSRELIRRGVIREQRDKVLLLREVLAFFGVNTTAEWKALWMETNAYRFRKSIVFEMKPGATSAWIRLGEIAASRISCRSYDKTRLERSLSDIRCLTLRPTGEWRSGVTRICAEAGVAVVFIPEIRGCPVSGLTQWLSTDKPAIQMSLRYKSDDHFWFTFFHEAGHILKDPKKAIFIEDGRGEDESEDRANKFASGFLIPPDKATGLRVLKSKSEIIEFARMLRISPGIVVGQMQRRGYAPHTHFNGLKKKIDWGD
jgi:plasmid maintenance system antidote protein VapI